MTRYQKYYKKRQEALRGQAIEFQHKLFSADFASFESLYETCEYFRYWGKRFGLLREFRENAIL